MNRKNTIILTILALLIVAAVLGYINRDGGQQDRGQADRTNDVASAQTAYLNLDYRNTDSADGQKPATLDLYLPEGGKKDVPLLAFIPGGFWAEHTSGFLLTQQSIDALRKNGMAVAIIRHRPAPAHKYPDQVEDVAAGLAYLIGHAGDYGIDPHKIYLSGHSSGGHLAALLALDPQYLARYQLQPDLLAGVIIMSGIFDVTAKSVVSPKQGEFYENAFGPDPEIRVAASPISHVHDHLPPMMILSAEEDLPGFSVNARRFMLKLRAAGNRETYYHMMPRTTHLSLIELDHSDNPALRYLLAFMKIDEGNEFFRTRLKARWFWHDPPVSTEPFWKNEKLVSSHAVDDRFLSYLVNLFQGNSYMLKAFPLEEFHAIDLYAYLDSLPVEKAGKGRYLVTTNQRGEKLYWDLEKMKPYKPVIVVGLDDERNLYRLAVFYETRRQFSWIEDREKRPLSVRPLGAFIYFLEPPPREFMPAFLANYSLNADSFRRVEKDPLAWLSSLPEDLHSVFTWENGCVSCHAFHGMNARSHHVNAMTLEAEGGFAIPLTSYPPEVWRRFVFHQEEAAKIIGVIPNSMRKEVQQPLFDLVEHARAATQGEQKIKQ
jgi:acetyl esterase/lipase